MMGIGMRHYEWRDLLVNAVQHSDRTQLDALATHLAACERAGAILQAHGHGCTSQPLDVIVCRALNVKALDE
jgi:hypothetical protein